MVLIVLIKQRMFAKYFLQIIGLNVNINIKNIKHTQLSKYDGGVELLPYYNDELLFEF